MKTTKRVLVLEVENQQQFATVRRRRRQAKPEDEVFIPIYLA